MIKNKRALNAETRKMAALCATKAPIRAAKLKETVQALIVIALPSSSTTVFWMVQILILQKLAALSVLHKPASGPSRIYVGWIRRLILHHNNRHPCDTGPAEVEAFLTHLAVAKRVSASSGSRSSTSRIRQPGTARSIPVSFRSSACTGEGGHGFRSPFPHPLPSGGETGRWPRSSTCADHGKKTRSRWVEDRSNVL